MLLPLAILSFLETHEYIEVSNTKILISANFNTCEKLSKLDSRICTTAFNGLL